MRNKVTITTNKAANMRYIELHYEIEYIFTIWRYNIAKNKNK